MISADTCGSSFFTGGRQRVACCQVDIPKPPILGYCPPYDWCQAFPIECAAEEDDAMGFDSNEPFSALDRRGESRELSSRVDGLNSFTSNRYPSRAVYIRTVLRSAPKVFYFVVSTICEKADVIRQSGTSEGLIPSALDTEHPVDVSLVSSLFIFCFLFCFLFSYLFSCLLSCLFSLLFSLLLLSHFSFLLFFLFFSLFLPFFRLSRCCSFLFFVSSLLPG